MKYLILALTALIVFFANLSIYLASENSKLKTLAQINNAVVESQNAAIEQIIIDTEKYHCDLDSMNDYARAKYDKVIHEHENETCEAKLAELEKALSIFGADK